MTYAPILSDNEHEVLIASLNLTARNVGMKIAQEGPTESFVGQLNAVQQLKSKLEAAKIDPAREVPLPSLDQA